MACGTVTNTATIRAEEFSIAVDPNTANNTSVETTEVTGCATPAPAPAPALTPQPQTTPVPVPQPAPVPVSTGETRIFQEVGGQEAGSGDIEQEASVSNAGDNVN